jgi:hypothetical protein
MLMPPNAQFSGRWGEVSNKNWIFFTTHFPKMLTVQEMYQHAAEHMIHHFNNINRQAGERSRREGMFLCIDKVDNLSVHPMYLLSSMKKDWHFWSQQL